jgi:EmrB/QacA subfamily drug resistance transporter
LSTASVTGAVTSPAPSRHAQRTLAVAGMAVLITFLDTTVLFVAFPDISASFPDASPSSLSWVLNGYTIVFASLLVPFGRAADRLGRRRVFVGGLLLFVAASAAAAAAPSVEALVAARVVQALGAAALMPTSLALLLAEIPLQKRPAAIGIWAATGGIAAAAGPPLGGLLVEASWRWVFLINLPVGLAAAVAATRILRESSDPEHARRPDGLGAVLLTAAVAALALGLVKAPDWGWANDRTIAALAGSVVALIVFVARTRRHPAPVVELSMLRMRSFSMAATSALLFSAGFGAMLLGGVLFLTQVWDYSVLMAGLAFAPGPFMAAVFALPAGRLGPRIGAHVLTAVGGSVFALGAVWWALRAGTEPAYASELLPGMLLTGIGVGLTLPSVSAAAVSALPPARLATGSAVLQMARQLGIALGVAILIAIFGHPSPQNVLAHFHNGWWFMAGAGVAAAIAGSRIQLRERQNQVTPALAQSAGSP